MRRAGRAFRIVATLSLITGACSSGTGRASGPPTATPPPASASRGISASPPPSPGPTPPPHPQAELVATLDEPLGLVARPGDPALYAVTRGGTAYAIREGQVDSTPVLDLSGRVSRGDEQGLLGLVFSSDGEFAYVNYTDRRGDTHIVEFAWRDGRADLSTGRSVLFVDQPFPNHNGGNLVFGPDGYLYIGLGDGGSDYTRGDRQGDPDRNGQNLGVLLGKMLRIQPRMPGGSLPPDGAAYTIPADNPFVHRRGARPEIWAYGLRNPWRYSFDRQTGDLWIGDVGAGAREEIDMQPGGSAGGQNYGWNILEGTVAYRTAPPDAIPPVYEYDHRAGACSITGGYVYRGFALPGLAGWYVFGDYCEGALKALRLTLKEPLVYVISGAGLEGLSAFGEDQQGELYALSLQGAVYKLVP
jgi:glucose/arabinose dehydrogenase